MDLNKILEELSEYKNKNKQEVLTNYIQTRLNTSLKSYYKELEKSITYLSKKDEVKLLNKLNEEVK